MARIIALAALTTLGLSGAPVHEPVHARGPTRPLILLLCVTSLSAPGVRPRGRSRSRALLRCLDFPDICRGWWSLPSSAGYPQPRPGKSPLSASCRAAGLARDTDRNHPDEVLGFALYPRLKANVADRRTLGLGVHVMRRAPH